MLLRARRLILCAGLLASLAAAGCATSLSETDVKLQLTETARPFAGMGPQQVIPVYAESRMVAIGLLAEARNDSQSKLSRGVALQLKRARQRKANAVVGGPYADLSDRILANALNLNAKGQVRGLRIVFVSDAEPTPELIDAAQQSQARLHHRTPR